MQEKENKINTEYINISGRNYILNKTRRKKSLKEFLEDLY